MARSDSSELVRLTVNLIPRAEKSMLLAAELTGDSKTDTVNRALQAYAYLVFTVDRGGAIYVREEAGGELMQVLLLGPAAGPNAMDEVLSETSGTGTATRRKSRRRPGRA